MSNYPPLAPDNTSNLTQSQIHIFTIVLFTRTVTGVLNPNGNGIVPASGQMPRANWPNVHTTIVCRKTSSPDFSCSTCLECFGWWTSYQHSLRWYWPSHSPHGTGRSTRRTCRSSLSRFPSTKQSGTYHFNPQPTTSLPPPMIGGTYEWYVLHGN